MEKTKVTVVTTTYNHEKYIEKCIKGIVSQKTNFKFQLLISDDCSKDKTREIIKKYAKKYPDIVKPIFREKNLGAMENFVQTLNEANTEYVALCDGDDEWTDVNKLQMQADFLDKHKNYSIVFHTTYIVFEDKSRPNAPHPINIKNTLTLKDLIQENMIPANTVMYRWIYKKKDSLIKDFPENIVPGDYFIHFMHAKKGKIYYIDKIMSKYIRQPSGMWYLNSRPDKQNEFYDLYGEKLLNFYKEVEKKLGLKNNEFFEHKKMIIQNTLLACLKLKKYRKFKRIYKQEKKDNKEIMKEELTSLDKKGKIKYYLLTDPLKLVKKGVRKIIRK